MLLKHVFIGAMAVALGLVCSHSAWAGDISKPLSEGSIFAEIKGNPLIKSEQFFTWVEKDKTMRLPKPNFTLGTEKAGETLIEMENKKVTKVVISFYNRGDNSTLSKEAFQKKIIGIKKAIDASLGESKPYKPALSKTAVKIEGYTWGAENAAGLLEYSFTGSGKNFKGEFIRLTIVPPDKASELLVDNRKVGAQKGAGLSDIKKNIVKGDSGEVYIDNIPMVDQGAKGYCAAATIARLVNYYGFDNVDQHQIAQIANTTAEGGTNPEIMLKGISRVLPGRFGLRIKSDLYKEDFSDLVKKYNRVAKKNKRTQIYLPKTGVIMVADYWSMFDADILLETKTSNKAQVDRWFKQVTDYIDQGIPLIWSVMLGKYKENKELPQSAGGHMRLIIGYDKEKGEILFSDSWGGGHEKKTVGLKEAMAMTTGMHVVIPQGR